MFIISEHITILLVVVTQLYGTGQTFAEIGRFEK